MDYLSRPYILSVRLEIHAIGWRSSLWYLNADRRFRPTRHQTKTVSDGTQWYLQRMEGW